jgi:hypothetical protein
MILQNAIQTAGNKNVSDIIGYAVQTRDTKGSINLSWNYNATGDLNILASLKPASQVAVTATPTNNYRSNVGQVVNNLDYINNYNRLKVTFGGIVRTVPLTVATEGLGQLIAIDPATTTNKLLRIVARSGATANATLVVNINNATGISKQINITLPIANTEYVIDDISWLTDGTYGVVNVPVTIDGVSKGTTTAVVTTVGTLPVNGTYKSVTVTGTLGAELINTSFYNNEFQKYGAKLPVKFCCFTDALPKITKELQDILCRDKKTGSYTKSKSGEFSIKVQKYGAVTIALLQGSDVFEASRPVRLKTDKIKTTLSGANIVIPNSGVISDIAIDCQALVRTVDNLTSANISQSSTEYHYSLNTLTNELVFASTIPVGTTVEVGYIETKVGQTTDLMQLSTDLPMVWYYTINSLDGKYVRQYELSTTGVSVDNSIADDSDTIDLTFTLSAEENTNFETIFKK